MGRSHTARPLSEYLRYTCISIRFSNERKLHTIHVSHFTYLVRIDSLYFGKMPQNSLWTFEALVVSFEHGITDRMRKPEA